MTRRKQKGGRSLTLCILAGALTSGGKEPPALTLVFAGDINLARRTTPASQDHWPATFAAVNHLLQADLIVANLESPLTEAPQVTRGIDLRAPTQAAQALTPFTHLSVENNHALDGGPPGRQQNLKSLKEVHVTPVTREATYQTVHGVKVALLAYLESDGLPLAQVRAASQKAAVVIVLPHWGAEYNPVNTRQRAQAHELAQAGATLIVGSGPHVLQGSERIGKTLVLYSLGNLLFDQPYPNTWPGALVKVQVQGSHLTTCAMPTFSRTGRVRLARETESPLVLSLLGLPPCTERQMEK